MTHPVDIEMVVTMLTGRIEALAVELLPNGVREGNEWRVGSIRGEPGRSMAVSIKGNKAGRWADFSNSAHKGDALDLVAWVLYGGDKGRAVKWARGWLGVDDVSDPKAVERARRRAEDEAKKRRRQAEADAKRRGASAMRIWLGAAAVTEGDPVWRYLAGRGIDLGLFPRPPRAIRYHENLWNRESDRHWPAMVAPLTGADGETRGVHRTWLQIHDDGAVTKAPLNDPKMTLGIKRGATIRLWKGPSGKALGRCEPEGIVLCEGIEDGLTLALAGIRFGPDRRVLACVDVGNMSTLDLPAGCDVWMAADNDAEGSDAYRSFIRAVRRFQDQGRHVRVARSPVGKDFNDILTQGAS